MQFSFYARMSRLFVLAVFLILFFQISKIDTKQVNLNLYKSCQIKGEVAFCKNRVYSGSYLIEGKGVTRVVFKRIDSHTTFTISKVNAPELRSIVGTIGSCPQLEMDGSNPILVEVEGNKCDVSSKSQSRSFFFSYP